MTTDHTTYRILDANLNRSTEALRVMEEYARFVLDDADLTSEFKKTRHALTSSISETIQTTMIRHRDIKRDVGCEATTQSEYQRTATSSVVIAAGKRLGEALRTLEEYGKILDPKFAATIERIRYQGYELERRITLAIQARDRFKNVNLYVILTEALCKTDWLATANSALRGGADCIQLREKTLPDQERIKRAAKLSSLCHEHEALFIVNDRPDIAVISHADGVHLGQDDISIEDARRVLPDTAIVGISTHAVEQVRTASKLVPDYIAVGPMFSTRTKPQNHIAGPKTLALARQETSLPLVAIGGIQATNADIILSTASCCLSVCTAVIASPDVEAACRQLRKIIDQKPSETNFSISSILSLTIKSVIEFKILISLILNGGIIKLSFPALNSTPSPIKILYSSLSLNSAEVTCSC